MTKDQILIDLSESENTKFGKEDFAVQSLPQKVFSSIWALESEVNSGGFSQYFQNSSAETVPFVAEALDTIGAPKTADVCRRAIRYAFPDGLPSGAEAISSAADDSPENTLVLLGALDEEFFAYPHSLSDLLYEYVSHRPDEFGAVPRPSPGI